MQKEMKKVLIAFGAGFWFINYDNDDDECCFRFLSIIVSLPSEPPTKDFLVKVDRNQGKTTIERKRRWQNRQKRRRFA